MQTIFLLSPARCDGRRAKVLINESASFDLAQRIRSPNGAAIGEVFSFLSGLYFRGKLAYAHAFGAQSFVITTDRGLLATHALVRRDDLIAFSNVDIAKAGERYITPLTRDVERVDAECADDARFVLLGSIATSKYVDSLTRILGERLLFPTDFVGRGDMSRGGLLLRKVAEGRELAYAPVIGAVRHGKRPAKLEPIKRTTR